MALINTTTTGVLGTTLFGDGAGELTVQKDGVTINKITAIPAFSAYKSASQTGVASAVFTKVTFNTEEFDTNNNYDTSTSRFTPTVAGYYQMNWNLDTGGVTTSITISDLYKNGSSFKRSGGLAIAGIGEQYVNGSALVYANGTTDYFEIYVYIGSGSTATVYGATNVHSFFQSILVKAA
jgi:hypothetical protein